VGRGPSIENNWGGRTRKRMTKQSRRVGEALRGFAGKVSEELPCEVRRGEKSKPFRTIEDLELPFFYEGGHTFLCCPAVWQWSNLLSWGS